MIRSSIQWLCVVFAMVFATSAGAYSDEQIAQSLQWEQKWAKVINRSISKYTSRIRSGLKGVEPARRDKALKAVARFMRERFSWRNEGRNFVQMLTKSCDRKTLVALVDIKHGKRFAKEKRVALANRYKRCAVPGYRKAMKHLYQVTKGFKPQVDRIIANAKT